MTDDLTIPKFLDRTGGKTLKQLLAARVQAEGSHEDNRYKFAEPNPNRDPDYFLRPQGTTDAEWAESKARRAAASAAKKTASFAKLKGKLEAKTAVPTDLKGRPLYAMPDKNVTASGVFVSGGKRQPAVVKGTSRREPIDGLKRTASGHVKVASDDLGFKVSSYAGTDRAKMKKFASANGVWKDGDQNAKNNGLLRMTVVNRLRGKLKREPEFKVVWP